MLSARVTNPVTKRLLAVPYINQRYNDSSQAGGVIASLFWDGTPQGQRLAFAVKWVSIFAIGSIIWLEITLFTSFTTAYFGVDSLVARTFFCFTVFFTIFFFVLRFGVRGFVFADLLHSPIIVLAGITMVGILIYFWTAGNFEITLETFKPELPWWMAFVFALHVAALNSFQILCTEGHWFRLWLLGDSETTNQPNSVIGTGVIWWILLVIGFSTFALTGEIGEGSISALLRAFGENMPYYLPLFWLAATGALFSTVDTQMYNALIVGAYNTRTGQLPLDSRRRYNSFVPAFWAAALFALAFYFVRALSLQFEKLLLVIVPFSVVVLPILLAKAYNKTCPLWLFVASVLGYVFVAGSGFFLESLNFFATLSAIFVPIILSGTIFFLPDTQPLPSK